MDITFFFNENNKRYENREGIENAAAIRLHSRGEKLNRLTDIIRPNEDEKYKEYRKNIIKPFTKAYFSKIITTLQKIRYSEDFCFKFSNESKIIREEETLKKYLTKKYPFFNSYENYLFTVALQQIVEDADGIFYVCPLFIPNSELEYVQPICDFIPTEKILHYEPERYLVAEINSQYEKRTLLYIGDGVIQKWKKSGKKNYDLIYEYPYDGVVPFYRAGGYVREYIDNEIRYESFLSPIIPFFDSAIQAISDHQINMLMHIHPDRYEFATNECKVCDSRGYTIDSNKVRSSCNNCNGTGMVVMRSPLNVMQINPTVRAGINETATVPTPPAGYITRPTEDVRFVKAEFDDNIRRGYAAINMEFLMNIPEQQSGVAKIVDRQELNTFLLQFTNYIIDNKITRDIFLISKQRYGGFLSDEELIAMQPFVQRPSQFDILSNEILANRLGYATDKKMPMPIISKLSEEYAESEFGESDKGVLKLKLINRLDPLPFKTEEEKMTILSAGGCTETDYKISSNIYTLVTKALETKEDFENMKYVEQVSVLKNLLTEEEQISTPKDIEAEAKAKLKGTVGGVQGILEIQQSVANGITSYDSAVALLVNIYGFKEDIAKQIVGSNLK